MIIMVSPLAASRVTVTVACGGTGGSPPNDGNAGEHTVLGLERNVLSSIEQGTETVAPIAKTAELLPAARAGAKLLYAIRTTATAMKEPKIMSSNSTRINSF